MFRLVVVRDGRVLEEVDFFWSSVLRHVRVGGERRWEEKKRRCI